MAQLQMIAIAINYYLGGEEPRETGPTYASPVVSGKWKKSICLPD
ncbi:hypothetical protein HCH_06051 [Hahella chejuensis KCTC 2396]|uniref:Uncharacterized protein n=1 Tax=Hahella chejuensis (strain KCTC 2396) TaxID=349521 RepID=Q2S9H2_HAHCH|nr:hypothetical protein HCH_06051 [Hahella chejuensis KCTC 2396]